MPCRWCAKSRVHTQGVLVAFNVFVSFIIDALTNENLAAAEDSEKNENLASFFTYIKEVRAHTFEVACVAQSL